MKDLIILAKGNSRLECPFDGAEVWGVNDVGSFPEFRGKHIDRVFTFDPRNESFLKEARSVAPIWSWQPYADKPYPLKEVMERFGQKGVPNDYFTNTLSYMIALGIYEKFDRMRMYGVDAPYGGIYFMEKSGLEYWIGRAQEAGIEVQSCEGSTILKTYDGLLYGQRSDCSIDLYLSERMHLMNMMPNKGDYDTVYRSNLIRWLLALKVREKDTHNIQLGQNPNGQTVYQMGAPTTKLDLKELSKVLQKTNAPIDKEHWDKIVNLVNSDVDVKQGGEFQAKIHFPYWTISFIHDLLRGLERKGELPASCVALYEKFALLRQPEKVREYEPRVSFVLATKDRAEFLRESFNHIKKLKTDNDELIVVDGSVSDHSKEVIEQNKLIINKVISGEDLNVAHALNKGYMEARGKYIKQLEDDDTIYPETFDKAIEYMDLHPEIDLLVCGGIKQDSSGKKLVNCPDTYGHKVEDVFNYGACGTGFIHRRESFAKFGLIDVTCTPIDREYVLRVIAQGGIVKFFPMVTYLHTVYSHSTSITGIDKWNSDNEALLKKYCPEWKRC
jgi:GT2 family glycosyltransferase